MNNLKTVILSAAVMAAFSSAQAEEIPVYPGYELTWHDEFDVDGTPASHWNYEHGFCRNNEDQWYQPQNAKVEDGCLVITARLDSIPNDRFDPASRRYPTNRPYARYSSSCLTTS
ncbi:MAG: beta-glucanase, partial [Muribaculaceae bacterium]|nr:beta-glucanase [Muribaculaceae bacterium]